MRTYVIWAGGIGVIVMFVVGLFVLAITNNPMLAVGVGGSTGFIAAIVTLVIE